MFGIFAALRSEQATDGQSQGHSPTGRANVIETTNAEVVLDVVGDLAARSTTVSGQMQEVSAGVAQQTTAISHVSSIADEVSDISDEMAGRLSHFELGEEGPDGQGGRDGRTSAEAAWTDGGFRFGTDR